MEYRKDIQGLRTIAVLFVFIFHLNSNWLPGGFIGVDIFFVISGYLISSIILSKLDNDKFSFIGFYKSRIKRIVPAYYFLLLIIAPIGLFVIIPSEVGAFRKSSPTLGKYVAVELAEYNKKQLFMPRGMGHGFLVLSDEAVFTYKVDNIYSPANEATLLWNDSEVNVDWGISEHEALLSEKDKEGLNLSECNFFL